jgi:hypothetical protein
MKNYATLFALFFSVIAISAQKKIPEPKTDTYSISRHYPKGDGYILSNINFTSNVVLKQPKRDKYVWQANIYEKTNTVVEGYVYNGKSYSRNELLNDFKIGLSKPYFKVKVIFNNGKSFTGWSTSGQNYDYVKNDENTSFGLRSISIVGNPQSSGIESSIKRELTIKEQKRKNEELRKKEEERIRIEAENKKIEEERLKAEAQKKEEKRLKQLEIENKQNKSREERLEEIKKEANSQAEILEKERKEELRLKKEAIDRNLELEKQRIEKESADNAAVRRRLAERRKEEEARKKREFEKSRVKAEKSIGTAFSSGISSLVDGGGSLKFVYGIRTIEGDEPLRSPLGASTLEIGAGFGKIGLSVGYSLIDNQDELNTNTDNRRERASGGTWAFGLDVTIFKFKFLNSDADFGINGEYGFGDLDFEVTSSSSDFNIEYATSFYGVGVQLKFLNFLYVIYGYGKFTTEETRISTITSVLDPVDGFYTKLGFGVKYDFGY